MNSHGLNSFIHTPTRIGKTSSTCIDHIFSNLPTPDLLAETLATAISDHHSILATLPNIFLDNKSTFITKRVFKEANYDTFHKYISTYDWNFIYSSGVALDTKFSLFIGKVVDFFDLSFPKKKYH